MNSSTCAWVARIVAASLPLLVVGACGGSDGGAGGTATSNGTAQCSSGVSGDTTISALSDSDKEKVCAYFGCSVSAVLPKLKGGMCAMVGAMATMMPSGGDAATACKNAKESCMSSDTTEANSGPATSTCSAELADCGATLNEVTACLNDSVTAMQGLLASFSCDKPVNLTSLAAGSPPSCAAVQQKCAALVATQSGTE